jgi:hypothetical protein
LLNCCDAPLNFIHPLIISIYKQMEWVAARRAMGAIPAAQNRHFLRGIS